jgi:hypothetical protein
MSGSGKTTDDYCIWVHKKTGTRVTVVSVKKHDNKCPSIFSCGNDKTIVYKMTMCGEDDHHHNYSIFESYEELDYHKFLDRFDISLSE